jgi:hypothetical protein
MQTGKIICCLAEWDGNGKISVRAIFAIETAED